MFVGRLDQRLNVPVHTRCGERRSRPKFNPRPGWGLNPGPSGWQSDILPSVPTSHIHNIASIFCIWKCPPLQTVLFTSMLIFLCVKISEINILGNNDSNNNDNNNNNNNDNNNNNNYNNDFNQVYPLGGSSPWLCYNLQYWLKWSMITFLGNYKCQKAQIHL